MHLVFVTKYRRNVFTKEMLASIGHTIGISCQKMGGELIEFGGEDDHIHLLVSLSPKVALCHFVGRLKGASSFVVRKKFGEQLKSKLWGKHLWSPSYCAISCGGAPLDTIKEYVKKQRAPSSEKGIRQSIQERGRFGNRSRVRVGKIGRA